MGAEAQRDQPVLHLDHKKIQKGLQIKGKDREIAQRREVKNAPRTLPPSKVLPQRQAPHEQHKAGEHESHVLEGGF